MQIVTFVSPIEFIYDKSTRRHIFNAEPGVAYLMSDMQAQHALQATLPDGRPVRQLCRASSPLTPRLRPFVASPLGGQGERVLFYCGSGGYGDQLLAWPAVAHLQALGYQVTVLCDPGNEAAWRLGPPTPLLTLPLPLAQLDAFDHVAAHDVVTNLDQHPGQLHPTDNHLHRLGLSPTSLTAAKKLVTPTLSLVQQAIALRAQRTVVIQLAGSNTTRNPPLPALLEAAGELADLGAASGLDVALTCDADDTATVAAAQAASRANLRHVTTTFDEFVGMALGAALVIGPDSFGMHLRGHARRPAVAIFGPLDPGLRVSYYPTVRVIWARGVCAAAPCFAVRPEFPPWCPPSDTPRQHCAVVATGTGEVVTVAKSCLQEAGLAV